MFFYFKEGNIVVLMVITIKLKKLSDVKMPTKEHNSDAGIDLYSAETVILKSGDIKKIKTGISVSIPVGYAGLIWDKSGLSMNNGLKTLGGVVDSGYRGEILVGIVNLSSESYTIEKNHKVAQMLIQKIEDINIEEVDKLDTTDREEKGFGSSGK